MRYELKGAERGGEVAAVGGRVEKKRRERALREVMPLMDVIFVITLRLYFLLSGDCISRGLGRRTYRMFVNVLAASLSRGAVVDGGGISLMEEGARTIEAVRWEAFVLCCLKTGRFLGRLKGALCNNA